MSDLLRSAIVEASALREVAMKNAETLVMERFSNKIKEAVDQMLDQGDEEENMGGGLDNQMGMSSDMSTPSSPSQVAQDVPLAATSGEKLCSCPEEDEEIEIDFGDLEQQMMQEPNTPTNFGAVPQIGAMDAAHTGDETDDEYQLKEDDLNNILESLNEKCSASKEKEEVDEQIEVVDEDMKELAEDNKEQVSEELEVDIEPVKSGWKDTSGSKTEYNLDMALAKAQDSKYKEEIQKLNQAMEDVEKKLDESKKESDKNKLLLEKAYKVINDLNLTNTKLVYIKRVYEDNSLNERQKGKIVESLSKVNTIDKVKVIYESVSNTVGVSSIRKQNESLVESLQRPSGMMFSSRQKKENVEKKNEVVDRMQVLAGIK